MSDTQLTESDVAVDSAPSAWKRFRPALLRLHFYAGLFVAPFILIAAFTGLLYALIPQIDSAVYRHELTVDHVGEHRLPLAEQLVSVRHAHPEGTVTSIRPPAAADETTQVALAVDDVPPDYVRTVFVDPYTGAVRGTLTTYGQWLPVRAWFDELHRNLHLGAFGRNYSELAASWSWVIAGVGLLLWIGHTKGRPRRLVIPEVGASGRRRLLSWHGTLGVWILAAVALLAVSGMTWSRFAGENVAALRTQLSWTSPSVDTALPGQTAGATLDEATALHGADATLQAAHDAHLRNPMWMYPPTTTGQGWQVAERKRDWPTQYDAIVVDPTSGAVTSRLDFAEWPLMAKMTDWIIDLHMGILFGVVNQVALIAVAIAMIVAILLGYRMWWRRRPTRGDGFALPTGARRGALSALRPHEAALLVLVLAGFGYFAPLFGLTLVIFVAVDVALGWRQRREVTR
ncbi:PepSY domain-containing protein [Mycobacterium sp. CBMA293]|uniref:PepSY-associated TM helix domain-containing protein n=1 Tax=unclassified Mycolicibacterium TaxID=2636767 RepID=UPI001324237E|nr:MULTISPECIES: PepSY domain-containing protein [unclassified Mycolicibacterium]MUL45490.1 PepSY domain-containing protein [Mycolicibacterium sp. CBMA 360]MUL96078.1 PepSY domain-containing protein [Mycolicibacterium sp. CBMA 230]MUL60160.1 PepSY domain-containing protein [Mycolicibacterium sp. CBMA 335]MUL72947.1 PepSY domain-containing protein [Mycolicibacterium sp. CBMA 311]MUM08093.1 peptidase [Mycolicibacterium sp. CBMA 213]